MSEEFHNPYGGTKLVLILQRPDGCILFLYKRDNGTFSRWSLPSGQVEIDEDLTAGLARIALDQLGLTQEQVGEAKFVLTYPDEDGNLFKVFYFSVAENYEPLGVEKEHRDWSPAQPGLPMSAWHRGVLVVAVCAGAVR